LIIEDDGQGFKPESKMTRSKGIGLIGMKERAALVGGTLEIESAPGKGTTIHVIVPASNIKRRT
jgi:signal transduction histidine kinase